MLLFQEMAITSIDGTDRANLMQLVEEHGGKVYGNMSKPRCTHLISDKTSGKKYTKAVEWKTIKIVQTRWIRKCIDLGHLIDETLVFCFQSDCLVTISRLIVFQITK